ncbi:MAG: transposase [Acidimicrobiales bacterium]|nr:transposase [Acidimicrobiales bacterium]
MQELVEAELTARIGAEHGERTESRTNQRNGHRPKLVSTPAGDLEVEIPKLRVGSFFPELLEPRRRIDKALWAVIMTAYITGTSTRKVDDLVRALGCDTGISKSHGLPDLQADRHRRRACCAPVGWITSPSSTCGSTPPTSMSATAARSSPRRW